MGFKSPDTDGALTILLRAIGEVNSPHNDGFTSFEIKKKLYAIKFTLDRELQKAAKFSGEEEFLRECEQKLIWDTLKK